MINPEKPEKNFSWKDQDGGIEKILVSKDNAIVVTSSKVGIKVWKLLDSELYDEIVSIEIDEDEANIMALSEGGEFFAYTGSNEKLIIWRINKEESQLIKDINL